METTSKYIRIREAAALTGLSVSRLYKMAAPKVAAIPCYKAGGALMFSRDELEAWMQARRRPTFDEQENAVYAGLSRRGDKSLAPHGKRP